MRSVARPLLTVLALAMAWACPWAEAASDAAGLRTEALAATCANCHGNGGRPGPASPVPALAGLPRDTFVARMVAFQAGQREATVMQQLAKGFSDAQIAALATWFAAQPR